MGIRGKWRAPDWSRGIVDPPVYCGNPIAFVHGKCDVLLRCLCVTITEKRGGLFRLDFYERSGERHVAPVFRFESEDVKARNGVNLTTRDNLKWRECCGYINAVRLGIFDLKCF